jgi:hypothetical protein
VKDQDLTISGNITKISWETPSIFELPMDETQGLVPTGLFGKMELPAS